MASLQLVLLGGFQARAAGQQIDVAGRKERALLAFDRERGTRARMGFITNQPRTFGVTGRFNF